MDSTSRAQAELPPAIWAEGGALASEEACLQRTELHEIEGPQLKTTVSRETGCGRHAHGSSPLHSTPQQLFPVLPRDPPH